MSAGMNSYLIWILYGYPTRHQLYGHLPVITKTIQVRRTRHAGHCWRSKDELISDELLWTPAYGQAKAGRPARTYIQQLDTGCSPEDLPEAMNVREKWRKRVRDIRARITTWWWWWWWRYSTIDTNVAWKKLRFILSVRSDFHMTDSLLIAVHAFVSRVSISFSVDGTLLPRKVNLSTSFREVPSSIEMWPAWL